MAHCLWAPTDISVAAMKITPPSLLVAKPSKLVAYIVIDEAKIPKEIPILSEGEDKGAKLVKLHAFARNDLKAVFSNYFTHVKVAAGATVPAEADVVIEPKVTRVEVVAGGGRWRPPSGKCVLPVGRCKDELGAGRAAARRRRIPLLIRGGVVRRSNRKPRLPAAIDV